MRPAQGPVQNRLLAALSRADRDLIAEHVETVHLDTGEVLFEPGDDVGYIHFPGPGTVTSLVLDLRDGVSAEAAMVGLEGAIGGIISQGQKPAFARGSVQIGGKALRLATKTLEKAKAKSHSLRDHFARYSDCLLAQVLQSVACNAVHDIDSRLARWLLTTQDRVGNHELRVTQDFIAEMLGVRRTYITRVSNRLLADGLITKGRGFMAIADRAKLEQQSCECYGYLRRHYEKLLPGVYPIIKDGK